MTLAKDNESEIKLLKNGKDSCTLNSRHVSIKQFWSTDRVKNGNIEVKHCPTGKMLADFMSKPIQGSLFTRFREVLMGWKHISTLFSIHDQSEECVENCEENKQKAKKPKMTYADILKCKIAVDKQNQSIGSGNLDFLQYGQQDLIKKKQSSFVTRI